MTLVTNDVKTFILFYLFFSTLYVHKQKHGTTSKPLKPTRLDTEEQEKIAKSGLEMKMVSQLYTKHREIENVHK